MCIQFSINGKKQERKIKKIINNNKKTHKFNYLCISLFKRKRKKTKLYLTIIVYKLNKTKKYI